MDFDVARDLCTPRLDLENYKFPSLDLLNEYEDDGPNIDMEEQNANKDRIIKVLRSFGIEISSIKASVGPTITLYEITPAGPGLENSFLDSSFRGASLIGFSSVAEIV